MARYRYARWDGSQAGLELDAEGVLAELTDDLLYNGDVSSALRRALQQGFRDTQGRRVEGLRDLLERLRQRRREHLSRHDLGSAYEGLARELRQVVDSERRALDDLVSEARLAGDAGRVRATEEVAGQLRMELDLLPPDLAGRFRALQSYDFTSTEARQRFEDLVDRLRQQALQSRFDSMAGAVQGLDAAGVADLREMFGELNRLLEMREQGQDTSAAFTDFMDRHGHHFPGRPDDLDQLLEELASQMAATQAVLNSMTREQRAQLQQLMDGLLEDLDLRWQVDRLGENLRRAFPRAGWERRYSFTGDDPLDLAGAAGLMNELGDIDDLENLLRTATTPGALAEVDPARAGELLGQPGAEALERLAELARLLEEAGLVETREGRLELTPRGLRRIGRNALTELFARLSRDRSGSHELELAGVGHERTYETKPYEYGDPFNLHIERTLRNALLRAGPGAPVALAADDFEIERTETLTRTSTVLMLDLSLSMPMRDNFLAAKKVAMALHALISTRYPRDFLGLVGFSEVARELKPEQLPEVSWDFVYGTNMQHALQISRRLLAGRSGTRQIIMITDGEPTAHVTAGGDVFFNYPPVRETVEATLAEVRRCTRAGVTINTFMLDATSHLRDFVDRLTRMNRGRAFFTTPATLGDYVLVDFMANRSGAGRAAG